jgi:hypothetical protein
MIRGDDVGARPALLAVIWLRSAGTTVSAPSTKRDQSDTAGSNTRSPTRAAHDLIACGHGEQPQPSVHCGRVQKVLADKTRRDWEGLRIKAHGLIRIDEAPTMLGTIYCSRIILPPTPPASMSRCASAAAVNGRRFAMGMVIAPLATSSTRRARRAPSA